MNVIRGVLECYLGVNNNLVWNVSKGVGDMNIKKTDGTDNVWPILTTPTCSQGNKQDSIHAFWSDCKGVNHPLEVL